MGTRTHILQNMSITLSVIRTRGGSIAWCQIKYIVCTRSITENETNVWRSRCALRLAVVEMSLFYFSLSWLCSQIGVVDVKLARKTDNTLERLG